MNADYIADWDLERIVNEFMAPSGRCSKQTIRHRRTHVRAFAKFLGRMPTADEIEFESLKAWYQSKIKRGMSVRAAQSALSHIVAVIRFADPRKFPHYKHGGDQTGGRGCPQQPCCEDQSHGIATPYTDLTQWALPCVVQCAMEPSGRYARATLTQYRARVRSFQLYLGRSITPAEVTAGMLKEFAAWITEKTGATPKHASFVRLAVSAVVKFADRNLLPEIKRGGGNGRSRKLLGRFRDNFADAKSEGTLEWYLCEHYFPSKSRIASRSTERQYGMMVNRFSCFLGRPAVLSDLNDLTLGKWIRALRQEDPPIAAATINGGLDKIRALWNWLAKKRFVEEFPTIDNVPEPQRIPRCWLEHELKALFEATGKMPGTVAGVRAADWWKAFLLFAWDSGERRQAILSIRWEHFDPVGGTMEVPAQIRKGGRKPMLYRLKPETVAAIELLRSGQHERIFACSKHDASFYQEYRLLVALAGLTYENRLSGPQKIRRTFASYIEANGGNATDALAHTMRRVTTGSYLDPRVTEQKSPNAVLFSLATAPRAPEGWSD